MLQHSQSLKAARIRPNNSCFRIRSKAFTVSRIASFSSLTRPYAKPRAEQPLRKIWHQVSQRRGAKKRTTVALEEMVQGPLQAAALPPQDDSEPEYPPLLQQVRNNMVKFSHCVLLTRVGGFYEVSFYSQMAFRTDRFSYILNTLTSLLRF